MPRARWYRLAKQPSRREMRNHLKAADAFYGGATEVPQFEAPKPRKRSSYEEREESSNDALKDWRRTRGDVRLWRNNVGVFQIGGRWIRTGLCPGSADFVGFYSFIVKPEHVGKRVAAFFAPESKARGKDAEEHQDVWLKEVIAAGGIAGVARNGDEAEELIRTWEVTK